jgi:hypothetical protein
MLQTTSATARLVVILGGAALLVLAIIYAAIVAIFISLSFQPTHLIIHLGEVRLYSEFGYSGVPIFLIMCLLSGYGGLAAILRWPSAWHAVQIAGWATIGLGAYGLWIFLCLFVPIPYPPFTIGMNLPPLVALALCVIGSFVLCATRKPKEKNS